MKGFIRTYGFLGAILPYGNPEWEKLNIFLTLLLPKLPSPKEEDEMDDILSHIDLESYRLQARAEMSIVLEDEDAELMPVPTRLGEGKSKVEFDFLSRIIDEFNNLFGNINWKDEDNVKKQLARIPEMVAKDEKYQNAIKNSDKQEARTESDRVLADVMLKIMKDSMELYKLFQDNPEFKKYLSDKVFSETYRISK